jgi:hypothetical protein
MERSASDDGSGATFDPGFVAETLIFAASQWAPVYLSRLRIPLTCDTGLLVFSHILDEVFVENAMVSPGSRRIAQTPIRLRVVSQDHPRCRFRQRPLLSRKLSL